MKSRRFSLLGFIALISIMSTGAWGADVSRLSPELCPASLKGLRELYIARMVSLSWAEFNAVPDSNEFRRTIVAGSLYTPVRKIALSAPFDTQLERRVAVPGLVRAAPLGYFIAYAPGQTPWLIVVENSDHVTIYQLKPAAAADDSQFSKLYWLELDKPRFESQSRSIYARLERELESGKQSASRGLQIKGIILK